MKQDWRLAKIKRKCSHDNPPTPAGLKVKSSKAFDLYIRPLNSGDEVVKMEVKRTNLASPIMKMEVKPKGGVQIRPDLDVSHNAARSTRGPMYAQATSSVIYHIYLIYCIAYI